MSDQERVERDHPRWRVWQAEESGIWWASVKVNLTPNEQRAGCVPYLSAATLAELDDALREEDARAGSAGSRQSAPTVPVRLRAWGADESGVDQAVAQARKVWSHRTWDITRVERLTGVPNPLPKYDPKMIAADAGYGWSYVAYPDRGEA